MTCSTNPSITVVQGDERPNVRIQYIDILTGTPIDISNPDWTPKTRFRQKSAEATLLDITMTKIDGGTDGWALLDWPTGALDGLDVGAYELQPYIDMDGDVITVTNRISVKVREKFAAAP